METQKDKKLNSVSADASVLTHGDILLYSLDYLGVGEVTRARLVCKYWKKVCDDERLWKGSRGQEIL